MEIEVVTTENGLQKETGFGSISACESFLQSAKKDGHSGHLSVCTSEHSLLEIVSRKPQLVVLAVKYIITENNTTIWLSGFFEQHGINYTGSTKATLQFDSDKISAKERVRGSSLNTVNYFSALPNQFKCSEDLPLSFPLFIKPIGAANGNGIDHLSLVNSFSEFESKVLSLNTKYNEPALVEEYIDGREFTVSIIDDPTKAMSVSAIEITPPMSDNGSRVLGQKTKDENTETLSVIADKSLKTKINTLAINAFKCLGIKGFGRIDIIVNSENRCFFMEANMVPGMTFGSSYFPKACELESEITYDSLVKILLEIPND